MTAGLHWRTLPVSSRGGAADSLRSALMQGLRLQKIAPQRRTRCPSIRRGFSTELVTWLEISAESSPSRQHQFSVRNSLRECLQPPRLAPPPLLRQPGRDPGALADMPEEAASGRSSIAPAQL